MTDELKPVRCGCGGHPIIGKGYAAATRPYIIWCPNCKITTRSCVSEAEAVEAWNKAMVGAKNATTTSDLSDLISRQDAIDALIAMREAHKADQFTGDLLHWTGIKAMLECLPSAEPERKKGKWIPVDSETVNGRCSVCGYESRLYENDVYGEHYCPNCGSWLRLA